MKTIILLFTFSMALILCSCASSDYEEEEYYKEKQKYSVNPCRDSLYILLKSQPLDSLSDREYQYMSDHEKGCQEYQAFLKKQKTYEKDVESASQTRSTWIGIMAAIICISLLTWAITTATGGK